MAFGSMTGLLGGGARLHRFYVFVVVVAKGVADLHSNSSPADSGRLGSEPRLLDFGLIVTGSGLRDLFVGGLVRGGRFFDDLRPRLSRADLLTWESRSRKSDNRGAQDTNY